MATEIDIPVSVSSKKGEREDDAFSSEFLDGKVTEHPGNRVKQLESGPNQPLETSSHVAETVNTQLGSDKRTDDEGGIFFQALSVPMVNTPDSCETTTTEDQEDIRTTKIETFTEENPNDDERVAVIASEETEDHNVVEAVSAQTEGSIDHIHGLIKGSDKDIEEVTEFCNKDESTGGSSNAKTDAGKEEKEGKEPEIVKTKENVEKDDEEIRPSVETVEKTEYEGLQDGIISDVCVSTQTKPKHGITEDEKKNDDGQMKSEKKGSEKAESEGLEVSYSMAPSKKEIASEDEDQEKEYVLNVLEHEQGNGDDVTGSHDATGEDIKETAVSQHATTVAYVKEQDLNETDNKSVDAQEASEQSENEGRDRSEQKPMESINKIVPSCSETEQEEQTEVIRPIVEIDEEAITILNKDDDQEKGQEVNMSEKSQYEDTITSSQDVTFGGLQRKNHYSESIEPELVETKEIIEKDTQEIEDNVETLEKTERLIHAIPTDVFISTQTEPEEKTPKNEEKNDEEVIGSDDDKKKKSESLMVMELCEELESEEVSNLSDNSCMVSNENVIASKEDQDKLYVSGKGQGGSDDVTSSQNASSEYIKETTTGQHATTPAYFEEGRDLNVTPKDIVKEGDDRTIDPQEESEQCENEAKDKTEQKQGESVNKIVHSSSEIEQKDDTEEIKPSDKKLEQQGLLHVITADTSNSTQTESHVGSAEHEENNGETIECDDGQTKKSRSPMVEACIETVPEKANEYEEGLLHSNSSSMVLNENEIVSKDEYQEKEQEFYVSEKGQHGGDDVTSSQNASSEDIKEMVGRHGTKVAYLEEVQGLNAMAKDILKEEAKDRTINPQEASEQYENEASGEREQKPEKNSCLETEQEEYAKEIKPSVETEVKEEQEGLMQIETQVESQQEATEHEEKNDEEVIESDDGPKKKSNNPSTEEVCKEIDAGKVEYEGVELFDNSSVKLKAIATLSKDEDREKEQELNIEQEKSISGELQAQVEKELQEDLGGHQLEDSKSENPCTTEQNILEEVGEKTTMKSEEITKQAFQESQIDTNKEIEAKLDVENQTDERENASEMKDEMSSELGQPMEQDIEEIQACRTTTISEKIADEIAKTDEDFSLGSKDDKDDNTIKEEKIFLDGRTREIEISALEHEPVEEKTTINSEITKQAFHESKSETTNEIEAKLDVENQADKREDRSEMKDEVVLTKKMSSELGQPMEQNVEIQACQTTTMSEKVEDEIAQKVEDLSLGSVEDTNDNAIKEEKIFLDGRTREIEIFALEHEPIGEKTTIKPEEITKHVFQENQSETNKDIEDKLETERSEMKDEVSSEYGQPMEQNVEEIQACQTTTMSERIEDEIAKKDADLSQGSIDDTNDNTIKEEEKILNGRTKEIEISALEHEPVGEKTTIKSEEISKQAFQESQSATNKVIEVKLDVENQADEREDRSEMKDEIVLPEKMSSELGQPMEQNVEIHECQTTTISEKIADEIAEKDEDLSLGGKDDKDDNAIKEEKSFLDERTKEIEISTLEHEPVGEKTTIKPEEIAIQAFHESQSETNKGVEAKLDAENQTDGREDRSWMKDEVVLIEKMSSELGQPTVQNIQEIEACRTTTMSEKIEDEIVEKDEDLSLGSTEDTNDNTIKEEKNFLNGRTREIEIFVLDQKPVGEKTKMKPEEITKLAFQESQSETNKEIEAQLDAENQADEREDASEVKDEVVLTEKMSLEFGQPMEQNVEDLSHGSIEDTNDNTTIEEKSFLDGRAREIEISALEHEPVEEKNGGLDEVSKQKYTDLNEATTAELQEDFIPSRSPRTSTESENLPIEDLDSVSEVEIPRVVPKSEDSDLKEECVISATATSMDEEKGTVTKEISSDEISYSDPVAVENSEVTEVRVDAQIAKEDLRAAEDINCESKASSSIQALKMELKEGVEKSVRISGEIKKDGVDEAPKQESIPTLEDAATLEPQVNLSNIESTYPSESDKSPTWALEFVCDVQTPEVVTDSKESKVAEERIVLATAEHTDENNGEEEQEIKTNEISSAEKKEQITESNQVVEHPSMMCPSAILIEESLELYGELKPTSELMIDEDQVDETKPQPEQSVITSENIMKYQTLESKLEHTSEKDLNRSWDMEENVTLTPENQINSTEDQNETMKNVILKENVVVEREKEEGRTEVKEQDSEEDDCPKEIENTSTSNLKELANEIEDSKPIPIEVKAESQRELKNIPENLSCLSKASSTIEEVKDDSIDEASRSERVPILEDAKALELQVNLPEIESIITPSNDQDGMKLREGIETIEQQGVLVSQLTDREILEEEATENRKEAPNHEFEKEEKDDEQISEIQTPEAISKMEVKEEYLGATNDSCKTLTGGLSSEKLLDELKEIDAKEDTELIVSGEEKAAEDSYQDAVAEVTAISQTEEVRAVIEKLVSMVPPEELTSPTTEDRTNDLVAGTDKTKVEHSSISNKDWNPEEFTETLLEDQRSVEKYIEEEGQDNFGVENKEAKSGNEVVEDVLVNEVLLEAEKAKESKSIKDNINKEVSCIPNQLTSATDEVCQIKRLNSIPNELLEAKGSVEDIGDPKLMAENHNLKAETFTIMKEPTEDMKQDVENTSETVASEFERLENMVTEEKLIEANANKEKETLDEPQADDPAKIMSDSISSSTEQDKEVRSEESSGHGDMHKLEVEPTEVDEIVADGKEVSAMLTENLQEASPEMIPVKHDPETATIIEKIEEIKDKDETLVDMDFSTSTKEVACLSNEKTRELQVSTLNTEIDGGKQDGTGDMLNKEREAVQTHEHISDIKFVDPPLNVEIREQEELMHCGSQEPSEDNALLSQNDKKIVDLLVQPSVQTEIIQSVDKRFEEAPAIDEQKHENDLDTAKARIVDVVSSAESPRIEQQHLDTKEATVEPINQENQSEQKKEADENIQSDIPIEKVPKQTTADTEIADEFLVMPVAKEEEEKSNHLQNYSREEEHYGKRTYQDLEAVTEPSQTDKLSDKVKKAESIDIQEETMAGGNLHKEETEKRTNITEATLDLHHGEQGDETCSEAAIPIEDVKNSGVELKGDMDVPVPKCASTRNPEVRSAILEVLSVMDATADKAGYNRDPNDKTAEAHVAEKGVLKEDVHLDSTCNRSKTTDKISVMNQEPVNLPLTKERSMELDAPVTPATAAREDMEISKEYVTDDLVKISQIQPELQKYEVSASAVDKQLPDKPYQNESMESKLLTGNIDASHEQREPNAKSLTAKAKNLKATDASGTEPQCSIEIVKEEKKISDEKEKSETPEAARIVFTDILHESTQGNSQVAENLMLRTRSRTDKEDEALTKDQQVDKEETGDNREKTEDEDEAEEDDEDNQKMGSCSDAPVMIEASKDMDVKVHKKSHNILSGVGSKVKHSIAKVKKAITGKSSHPKPPSPKERD
ncbi:titin [Cynara cardunculus var. scolymus]|uniref:titin n=1 Tax=Cynara cardunculus var. scolymus TaxID=59895 RepID=UPI000D62CA6D|nr:titin [Cynara cardunculus var. scolymus]